MTKPTFATLGVNNASLTRLREQYGKKDEKQLFPKVHHNFINPYGVEMECVQFTPSVFRDSVKGTLDIIGQKDATLTRDFISPHRYAIRGICPTRGNLIHYYTKWLQLMDIVRNQEFAGVEYDPTNDIFHYDRIFTEGLKYGGFSTVTFYVDPTHNMKKAITMDNIFFSPPLVQTRLKMYVLNIDPRDVEHATVPGISRRGNAWLVQTNYVKRLKLKSYSYPTKVAAAKAYFLGAYNTLLRLFQETTCSPNVKAHIEKMGKLAEEIKDD